MTAALTTMPPAMTRSARCAAICLFAVMPLTPAAADTGVVAGYSITTWIESDAGPLGAVSAIVQDADGYLWVGTTAGLFRFDGVRFTPWESLSEAPLPRSPVSALHVARDGSLWAGFTNRAGVAHIVGRRVELSGAGTLRSVNALVEDRQGAMWAVDDPGLYRLTGRQWDARPIDDATQVRAVAAGVTQDGTLWVGSSTGLYVQQMDGGFRKAADDWVWDVSEQGSVTWLTDTLGGFRRMGERERARTGFEANGYRLAHDRLGQLWVATIGEGLWRVRANPSGAPVIEKATLQSGLFSDSVQALLEDRDGNLWVGTTVGLHRLTRQKLTPLTNVGLVTAAAATGDAGLWAGTNYGLVKFTQQDGQWTGRRIGGPELYVQTLHRDAAGVLWIGANEGLRRLSGDTIEPVPLPREYALGAISCLSSDTRGGIWIGDGRQILHWDRQRFVPLQLPRDYPDRAVCLHNDQQDRLWIGFPEGRLAVRHRDGTFAFFPQETFGPYADTIHNVTETKDGTIWVATNGGVTRFANGRFTTLTRLNGLPADRVWAVVDDLTGSLWISQDVGITRLHPDEFDKAAASPSYRIRYEAFDSSDGLAGAPILRVRTGRAADGRIWFVRGGALTVADPRAFGGWPRPIPAPVRIERATTEERRFAADNGLELPAGTKRVEIDYTTVALTSPNRLRFRYRLEGFDTDWIQAGTRRSAVYTNLPPRSYRFLVEGSTEEGGWKESMAGWEFRVRPAYYQAAWFYAAAIAAIGALVWTTWRVRVGVVRRQYSAVVAERARLSREIHDTLLQSLVGVALQLDALEHGAAATSRESAGALRRMRRQVEAYIREARQSISDLRSPLLETRTLADALREIGRDATADTPVHFSLAVSGRTRPCATRLENELLRIGQEAITNAVRHAKARHIELELRFAADAVALRVVDDGQGLLPDNAAEAHEAHYGLTGMKERAEHLGGRFRVASLPQGGTEVEAVLPSPAAA